MKLCNSCHYYFAQKCEKYDASLIRLEMCNSYTPARGYKDERKSFLMKLRKLQKWMREQSDKMLLDTLWGMSKKYK
jgi:hypothetical protein